MSHITKPLPSVPHPTAATTPPDLPIAMLSSQLSTTPAPAPKRYWHLRTTRHPAKTSSLDPTLPVTNISASQNRRVSEKSAKSAKSTKSAQSHKSDKSASSSKSNKSTDSKKSSSGKKLPKLPPVDLSLPLSKLSEALDLAPLSAPASATKERRATKAALALRSLILDAPNFDGTPLTLATLPHNDESAGEPCGTSGVRCGDGLGAVKAKGKPSKIPQLREKDVDRLRTQLLKPDEAKLIIASARSLPVPLAAKSSPVLSAGVERAVCLDCSEDQADHLIVEAKRIEHARREKEKAWNKAQHRFSTLSATMAPPPPPRLPVLLSLFSGLTTDGAIPGAGADSTIMTLGLFEPASAMSLHRPLAGALPSADTLRRGFDALINAESKIYLYEGPSHKNIHPPTDRISVYTWIPAYRVDWWGFELALPPPTMAYLAHAKSIATSILNLLSVIVYAVPGGTRELAPFVGVLSRFIENEWNLLKSQDHGKGVVCGATWFIPAALVARPWDFGEETIRDHLIHVEEEKELVKGKVSEKARVKVKGEKGVAEGVVIGVGRGMEDGRSSIGGQEKMDGEKSVAREGGKKSPVMRWSSRTGKLERGSKGKVIESGKEDGVEHGKCEKHRAVAVETSPTPSAASINPDSPITISSPAPPVSRADKGDPEPSIEEDLSSIPPAGQEAPAVPVTKIKSKSKNWSPILRPKSRLAKSPLGSIDVGLPGERVGRPSVSDTIDTPPLTTPVDASFPVGEPEVVSPPETSPDVQRRVETEEVPMIPVISAFTVSKTLGARTIQMLKGTMDKRGAKDLPREWKGKKNVPDGSLPATQGKKKGLRMRRSESRSA